MVHRDEYFFEGTDKKSIGIKSEIKCGELGVEVVKCAGGLGELKLSL